MILASSRNSEDSRPHRRSPKRCVEAIRGKSIASRHRDSCEQHIARALRPKSTSPTCETTFFPPITFLDLAYRSRSELMPPILVARRLSERAHRPKRVQRDFLPPNLLRQHPTFEKCGRKSHAKNSEQNQRKIRGKDSPRNPISKVDEPRDMHESRDTHEPRDACDPRDVEHVRWLQHARTSGDQTIAPSRLGYCVSNSRMTTRRSGGANGFGMNR